MWPELAVQGQTWALKLPQWCSSGGARSQCRLLTFPTMPTLAVSLAPWTTAGAISAGANGEARTASEVHIRAMVSRTSPSPSVL